MAQQLTGHAKNPVYVIFDEFSVFAGEQVLNVINMGRSAGIHAVLNTFSVQYFLYKYNERFFHGFCQTIGFAFY